MWLCLSWHPLLEQNPDLAKSEHNSTFSDMAGVTSSGKRWRYLHLSPNPHWPLERKYFTQMVSLCFLASDFGLDGTFMHVRGGLGVVALQMEGGTMGTSLSLLMGVGVRALLLRLWLPVEEFGEMVRFMFVTEKEMIEN